MSKTPGSFKKCFDSYCLYFIHLFALLLSIEGDGEDFFAPAAIVRVEKFHAMVEDGTDIGEDGK